MEQIVETTRRSKSKKYFNLAEISGTTELWFGMFKGWPLAIVPPDYLLFIADHFKNLNPELKRYIRRQHRHLQTQLFLAK